LPIEFVYARPLYPGVYGGQTRVWHRKLGAVCAYPCPNVLVIVCCGITKVGAEQSMVVLLWKWFIGRADGFMIVALAADLPLVCGLI
jgi:hypothetical protein